MAYPPEMLPLNVRKRLLGGPEDDSTPKRPRRTLTLQEKVDLIKVNRYTPQGRQILRLKDFQNFLVIKGFCLNRIEYEIVPTHSRTNLFISKKTSFLASSNIMCHLWITFANSLDPDQDQNFGPDLGPNCLTLR